MSVLLKYQLKALFESGDLMTQDSLVDLIDSTYNPVLVAGTGVTLNTVTTPSGTTVTINAQSGIPFGGLTTIGSSGPATLSGAGVLNIPIYSGGGNYTNTTAMPQSFPGTGAFANIAAGTTFIDQTFTEMMDAMLYPTLDPSLSNPSSTFTLTQQGLQETGATLATLNFNATLNRGSINPQYTSASPFRSGLPNAYDYTGTTLPATVPSTSTSNAQTISNYLVLLGPQSWTGSVDYDAGVQPKDSGGGDFGSPLPAGTTSTITRTITGVYRVFATTATAGTLSPQSLQSMTSTIQVSMVAEVPSGPKQAISIPAAWSTITGLKQFSPFTNQFEVVPNGLAAFTVTNENRNSPDGTSVAYKLYTHNGNTIGARQLQFTT
jgi:hypothetical protein